MSAATDKRRGTIVYMSTELLERLARYIADKGQGLVKLRSQVIVRAIEEFLKREGY